MSIKRSFTVEDNTDRHVESHEAVKVTMKVSDAQGFAWTMSRDDLIELNRNIFNYLVKS